MATRSGRGGTPPKQSRMARLRERRRKAGAKQITAFLSEDASEMLAQMVAFSKRTQSELLSDAIHSLADDYEYWDVRRPRDDGDDEYEWTFTEYDSSHREGRDGLLEENPHFETRPVPPWIVERERRAAAIRKEVHYDMNSTAKLCEGLDVYRRGVRSVTGDGKKR